ncbi:MAG: YdeI/OmpD-associated family protein [Saprospiraceae bacterium]
MKKLNPKVDEYINKAQNFAKPILLHFRKIVHSACPEVEEKIKWSFPHYDYNGNMMCSMASFTQHCAINFWLSNQMEDPDGILLIGKDRPSMGHLGRITSIKDLPNERTLIKYIHQAMKLSDQGIKLERKPTIKKELIIPEYFIKALSKNKSAKTNFEAFPYSHKKEYVEWIVDAKTEPTRERRITQAIELIAQGKGRNWKYEK